MSFKDWRKTRLVMMGWLKEVVGGMPKKFTFTVEEMISFGKRKREESEGLLAAFHDYTTSMLENELANNAGGFMARQMNVYHMRRNCLWQAEVSKIDIWTRPMDETFEFYEMIKGLVSVIRALKETDPDGLERFYLRTGLRYLLLAMGGRG